MVPNMALLLHYRLRGAACITMRNVRLLLVLMIAAVAGCSSGPRGETAKHKQPAAAPAAAASSSRHPYAKYLEVTGFRIRERAKGKLEVKCAVINHSEANLGDVTLKVRLTTSEAAPEDPPVTEFEARVLGLGPLEVKDVTGVGDTSLRVYELPDWQFLRASFEITFPAP
jgi:hypothetical protein